MKRRRALATTGGMITARAVTVAAALTAVQAAATLPALAADAPTVRYPAGATTFQANCAVCHGAKGAGTPSLAPPITSYPARYAANAEGRKQLAITVLNFVVFDLDHAADDVKPITAEDIASERAHPVDGAAVREHRTKLLATLGL
jgi:cytochrome c5